MARRNGGGFHDYEFHRGSGDSVRPLPSGSPRPKRRPAPLSARAAIPVIPTTAMTVRPSIPAHLQGIGEMGFSFKSIGRGLKKAARGVGRAAGKVGKAGFKVAKVASYATPVGLAISQRKRIGKIAKGIGKGVGKVGKTAFKVTKKAAPFALAASTGGTSLLLNKGVRRRLGKIGKGIGKGALHAGKAITKPVGSVGGAVLTGKILRPFFGPKLPDSVPMPDGSSIDPVGLETSTGVPAEAITDAAIAANNAGDDPDARADAVDAVEEAYGLDDDALSPIANAVPGSDDVGPEDLDAGGGGDFDSSGEAMTEEADPAEDVDGAGVTEEVDDGDARDFSSGDDDAELSGIDEMGFSIPGVKAIGRALGKAGSAVGHGAAAVGKGVGKGAAFVGKNVGKGAAAVGTPVGRVIGKGAEAIGKETLKIGQTALNAAAKQYLGLDLSGGGGGDAGGVQPRGEVHRAATSNLTPMLLVGGAGLAAFVLLKKK